MKFAIFGTLLLSLCTLNGCHHASPPKPAPVAIDYTAPLPEGALALHKLSPGEYPDFSAAILAFNEPVLDKAIDRSLKYLAAPSSKAFFPYLDITHQRAVDTLTTLKQILHDESPQAVMDGGRQFNAIIKRDFDIYESVGAPDPATGAGTGQVLFTGYCTPIFDASLTRGGRFQYPIYKRPNDLVTDATGTHASRQLPDGTLMPFYTRQQIDQQHVLAGDELCWLTNPFDVYVVNVQGSARLRLRDGRLFEIGYNGNNGYPYTSPGDQMVADGAITQSQHTTRGIQAYFISHPGSMEHYLSLNQRYIFFKERPGGPFGKLNVPVTPFGTIATDKTVYPRAMPAFLDTQMMTPAGMQQFKGIMLDQDAGGAIRAAGRCDIYMGIGASAQAMSGQQLYTGRLYYLAVKERGN